MKTIHSFTLAILLSITSVFGQTRGYYSKAISFHPDLYVGELVGTNAYFGEQSEKYVFSNPYKSLGYSIGLNLGYHATPSSGVMLHIDESNLNYLAGKSSVTMVSTNIDLNYTLDLMNAFGGYSTHRNFVVDAYFGPGVSYRSNPDQVGLYGAANVGLVGRYLITNNLSVQLSGSLHFIGDSFNNNPVNGTQATPFDFYPSLGIGLFFHFNVPKYHISRVTHHR